MLLQKYPKLSIITPSFNQAEFLEATIQSVLSQNYPNLEYIIIDGGSNDGSVEIIKKYEKQLAFWCSEPDDGQYHAINKGFSHSTGEIMAWINSDDMYCPWAFRTVASIISELPQIEWLTSLQPGGWDWHGFCQGFALYPGFSKTAFLDGYYIGYGRKSAGWIQQESTFWQRSLWEKAGGYVNTDLKLASDFELWSRFFIYAELYGTNSPLGGIRHQSKQKSRKIEEYANEAEKSLSTMRDGLGYSTNIWRNIIYHFDIHQTPKLKKVMRSLIGYTGKKIVRQRADLQDSYWYIKEYKFI
ncbi:glycosyltransferase [Anabaena sp. FACHB-1250]|jgi:glycosyltransferase involved in cell wall biosynthesis|uniref:Glycosyl transferase, family 2 n=1 Tax=Dolichospermum planctonicum TaxID=136072 RepID=A0A480ABW5_9CYAN|nr:MULTISPECIES: glycosyltransferase family 2 protein [Nostocales]MBD2141672.1 glycosyltransferase [Anabaena sp. FACHB-1250]MBD2267616.1 glycosyltransferase [Anabaena sp. FACHB-1391]GCL41456.1 glycosyl transferase, family 2 [Dolichospermum planctonicum]